jgi:putative restriction endonuclease
MALSTVDRIRLDKAAVDEGFGVRRPDDGGWMAFDGLGMPASLRLFHRDGVYFVAVNHAGVADELEKRWQALPPRTEPIPPLGFHHFAVQDTAPLQELIREAYQLARALPPEPLRAFEAQTAALPRGTEAERWVVQRVGQDLFRAALDIYWEGRCAVTGVGDRRLLRASHMKPWARCETNAERLDSFNGLLLAAHLDAAFDAGLISFADSGEILLAEEFGQADRAAAGIHAGMRLTRLAPRHMPYLAWHRKVLFANERGLRNEE